MCSSPDHSILLLADDRAAAHQQVPANVDWRGWSPPSHLSHLKTVIWWWWLPQISQIILSYPLSLPLPQNFIHSFFPLLAFHFIQAHFIHIVSCSWSFSCELIRMPRATEMITSHQLPTFGRLTVHQHFILVKDHFVHLPSLPFICSSFYSLTI